MLRAGIINVTGYSGIELARLLYRHPEVKVACVTGRSAAGQSLGETFPHLSDLGLTVQSELERVDVVFSALPHKASAEVVAPLVEEGIPVIDISADFRLKDPAEYEAWYETPHPAPHLLEAAVYGLTELHRSEVASARLIANPGCYPTSALLALAPAIKAGLIEPDIIIDSKSGVSGAGRTLGLMYHYSEANENVQAYSLEGHRHLPEIVQEIEAMDPTFLPRITFVPHLIPMTRGILSSCYAELRPGVLAMGEQGPKQLLDLYRDFYSGEPFVRVTDVSPQTKQTWGNNLCLIHPRIDQRTHRLIVISCLDNLVKGAAGQAIQNMNVMLGLPEGLGLEALAVYP